MMTGCRGELYPCETDVRLCDELETGQEVEVDMNKDVLTVLATGKQYELKPIGEVCHCCSPAFALIAEIYAVANTLITSPEKACSCTFFSEVAVFLSCMLN